MRTFLTSRCYRGAEPVRNQNKSVTDSGHRGCPPKRITLARTVLSFLCVLCALCGKGFSQTAPQPGSFDYTGKTFTFLLMSPPTAVPITQISASALDNPGPCTYYYWLVARFTIGNPPPTGPLVISNASCTLTRGNQISWTGVNNATGYDVLRTTTATPPSGTANIAVATNVAGPVIDTGGSLSSYTVATVDPASFNCEMDNEPTGPGTSKLTVHPTPCGFGVPTGTCITAGLVDAVLYDTGTGCGESLNFTVTPSSPFGVQIGGNGQTGAADGELTVTQAAGNNCGTFTGTGFNSYTFDASSGTACIQTSGPQANLEGLTITSDNSGHPGIGDVGLFINAANYQTGQNLTGISVAIASHGATLSATSVGIGISPDGGTSVTADDLGIEIGFPFTGFTGTGNAAAIYIGPITNSSATGIGVLVDGNGDTHIPGLWGFYQAGTPTGLKNNFDATTIFSYSTANTCARFDAGHNLVSASGDCSSGAGTGTVTSVGLALPASLFTVSGSPVTTSGTLTAAFSSIGAHLYLGNNTGSSATAALVQPQYSDLGGGIPANGATWKHQSVTTGSIAAAGASAVTLTWTTAFADASYDPYCGVLEATGTTSTIRLHHVSSILAASVTAVIVNDDGANPHTGTLYCQGIHP